MAAEAGGRTDSVFVDLEIPNFDSEPLSLSGPLLAAGDAASFGGAGNAGATARRDLLRTETMSMYARVYQGGRGSPRPVAVAARIRDSAEVTLWQENTSLSGDEFATDRAADFAVTLPLADLASGEYLLTLEITREQRTLRRDVRFSVR